MDILAEDGEEEIALRFYMLPNKPKLYRYH